MGLSPQTLNAFKSLRELIDWIDFSTVQTSQATPIPYQPIQRSDQEEHTTVASSISLVSPFIIISINSKLKIIYQSIWVHYSNQIRLREERKTKIQ
jgi:hypothetical protein